MKKGTIIRVQTRTKQDVFGDCMYEITKTGLKAPEVGREDKMDGVKCVMLGGTGPSARKGYVVIDSEEAIQRNITEGITVIISAEKSKEIIAHYGDKAKDSTHKGATGCVDFDTPGHSGTGVVEM